MNDELQKALAEFVKTTTAGLAQGKDFVLTQAPDVVQQLLRWKWWEAMVWTVCAGGVGIAAIVMLWRLWASDQLARWDDDGNPMCVVAPLVLGIVSGACLLVFIANASAALQITVAPKVWLIEWAMARVKK